MHLADRARDEVAAHRRDDAEAAAMVAALGDLQVRVVPRRQLDAGRRHEVGVRIVRLRQVPVHVIEHLARRMRPGDRQHLRMHLRDQVLAAVAARAEAAGDDDLAVFGKRLADRVERFLHGGVDEAAGVDDDEVGALVASGWSRSPPRAVASGSVRSRPAPSGSPETQSPPTERWAWRRPERDRRAARVAVIAPQSGYFFSPGKPGKPVNIERAWFCMFSCICTNRFFDCSM